MTQTEDRDDTDESDETEKPKVRKPIPFVRKARVRAAKRNTIVAYDLETTRIAKGTPRPLYLTVFGADLQIGMRLDKSPDSIAFLGEVLRARVMTDDRRGTMFVGWNANGFDAYFVAAALLRFDDLIIKPFLTRGKSLRGMLVLKREDSDKKKAKGWYFLDGMAMLGLPGVSLEKFLATFAPEYRKLGELINFETEEFDGGNELHCAYAMRDSEGLWRAMQRAESIIHERFNEALSVTMGRVCIRIFQAHIPDGVVIGPLKAEHEKVFRDFVMRGGYCHCARRYEGPVWKYDINQAYAAAMRDCDLPAGYAYHVPKGLNQFATIFVARIEADNPKNKIPFYCRAIGSDGAIRAVFAVSKIPDTWITSVEYEQLISEGWRVKVKESIFFDDCFRMTEYIDKLESQRMTCDGGPSGAIGTMLKAVGNHSYGKTVEVQSPLDLVLALDCPDGFAEFFPEDDSALLEHAWYRMKEPTPRDYHKVQIGAWITSHVRMVLRRACLVSPDSWLYADTDCVVFSIDVTSKLDIDPKRYGAFKIEETGTLYRIIAKKVYATVETKRDDKRNIVVPVLAHAKGLNVKRLTADDFEQWFNGAPPNQLQVQRNSFVRAMVGDPMYRESRRRGTAI